MVCPRHSFCSGCAVDCLNLMIMGARKRPTATNTSKRARSGEASATVIAMNATTSADTINTIAGAGLLFVPIIGVERPPGSERSEGGRGGVDGALS